MLQVPTRGPRLVTRKPKTPDRREFPAYVVSEAAHYLTVPESTPRYWAVGRAGRHRGRRMRHLIAVTLSVRRVLICCRDLVFDQVTPIINMQRSEPLSVSLINQ